MNIFCLDRDPTIAASMMVDKHVVKMILETAQLLSTAHRVLDGEKVLVEMQNPDGSVKKKKHTRLLNEKMEHTLMLSAMPNHPCSVWTRTSNSNYNWLLEHFFALLDEYGSRYKKNHALWSRRGRPMYWQPENAVMPVSVRSSHFADSICFEPQNIPDEELSEFPQAMPEECKRPDSVEAYRVYYAEHKRRFAAWRKPASVPAWWPHPVIEEEFRWRSA